MVFTLISNDLITRDEQSMRLGLIQPARGIRSTCSLVKIHNNLSPNMVNVFRRELRALILYRFYNLFS